MDGVLKLEKQSTRMDKIQQSTKEFIKNNIPEFGSGDTSQLMLELEKGQKKEFKNLREL